MAQEKKDGRIVIKGVEAREALMEGARAIYDTVSTTYGPKGRNCLIEKPYGRPVLSRDGVTVARDTYFSDRSTNMGAQLLLEASETTNRIAGDGTSASVVLGYNLMKHGNQAISAGVHPMEIKQTLLDDSYIILDKLEEISTPVSDGQLEQVATVSSGSPLLGQLISEAVERVGADGGIITEKSYVQEVEREYIDGYFLQTGFEALQSGKKEISKPFVIVSSKRMSAASDAVDLLNNLVPMLIKSQAIPSTDGRPTSIPKFLFIGNFEEGAYATLVNTINQGQIDAAILKTPGTFGGMSTALLEDIAIYAGCATIDETTDMHDLSMRYVGEIDKVVSAKHESTLFADNSNSVIKDRINSIKEEIEVEQSDPIKEKLRDRVAKLEGKIALFRVGGATDTEREELEFRVEDAILATRAAYAHGVVSGGGVTLLELSKLAISETYRNALHDTFKKLLTNANLPAEVKLAEILAAPMGQGYNLRESGELVDMVASGVLDPKLVVEQVIKNATSVAASALTTDVLLIFENKEA